MNVYSDTELHRDHRLWTDERALWHDDVRVWEKEVDELLAKLKRLEIALEQQKRELQAHAAAVRLYQECDGRREHALVQYERDGNEERGTLLEHAHEGAIQEHQRQRERHAHVKATQRRLMAELRPLGQVTKRVVANK